MPSALTDAWIGTPMYELWRVIRIGPDWEVGFLGRYPSVADAKLAAYDNGPGRYRVCDRCGDVARIKIRSAMERGA